MRVPSRGISCIRPSEITSEAVYHQRRRFLTHTAAWIGAFSPALRADCGTLNGSTLLPGERPNSYAEITTYNNFYEYSPDKRAVATLAQNLMPRPWSLRIEGEVEQPKSIDIEQLVRVHHPEERIYRLRCIEGWSMVIPWEGIPLCRVLTDARPTSRARFVEFVALHDPARFYGQRRPILPWPYTEALTITEAMHP